MVAESIGKKVKESLFLPVRFALNALSSDFNGICLCLQVRGSGKNVSLNGVRSITSFLVRQKMSRHRVGLLVVTVFSPTQNICIKSKYWVYYSSQRKTLGRKQQWNHSISSQTPFLSESSAISAFFLKHPKQIKL